jgi:hypothetical protein
VLTQRAQVLLGGCQLTHVGQAHACGTDQNKQVWMCGRLW